MLFFCLYIYINNNKMSSSYRGIILEKRDGDEKNIAKYNIVHDGNETREYFSKTEQKDKTNRQTIVGKSVDGKKWDITKYSNDKKTTDMVDHGKHGLQSTIVEFTGVHADSMFSNKAKAPAKKPAKAPAKKSSKKGGAKKKSKKKSKKGKK